MSTHPPPVQWLLDSPDHAKHLVALRRLAVTRGGFGRDLGLALVGDAAQFEILLQEACLHQDQERYQLSPAIQAYLTDEDENAYLPHYEFLLKKAYLIDRQQKYADLVPDLLNITAAIHRAIQREAANKAYQLLEVCRFVFITQYQTQTWLDLASHLSLALHTTNERFLWAAVQTNLAQARLAHPLQNPDERMIYLNLALNSCRLAQRVYDARITPLEYARTEGILGQIYLSFSALPSLSSEKQADFLDKAISKLEYGLELAAQPRHPYDEAWTEALRLAPEAMFPHEIAVFQQSLALAYYALSPYRKREQALRQAIQAQEKALNNLYFAKSPYDLPVAQVCYGQFYLELAMLKNPVTNLHQAIRAFYKGLELLPPDAQGNHSVAWQSHLGDAFVQLSLHEHPAKNLQRAIRAYRRSLRKISPTDTPRLFVRLQSNVGRAYQNLSQHQSAPSNLKNAVRAFEKALRYALPTQNPYEYADIQNNLGVAYTGLAHYGEHDGNLRRALQAYERALRFSTAAEAPLEFMLTHHNKAIVHRELQEWREAYQHWQEAKRLALVLNEHERAVDFARWLEEAERNLPIDQDF